MREQDMERVKREVDSAGGKALELLLSVKPWLRESYRVAEKVSKVLEGTPHALTSPLALPLYGVPQAWGGLRFSVRDVGEASEALRRGGFTGSAPRLIDPSSNMVVEVGAGLEWDGEMVDRLISRSGVSLLSAEDFAAYVVSAWGSPLGDEAAAKVLYACRGDVDEGYLLGRAGRLGVEERVRRLLEMVSRL